MILTFDEDDGLGKLSWDFHSIIKRHFHSAIKCQIKDGESTSVEYL